MILTFRSKISFAVGYWLIWTGLFELARLAFVLYNHSYASASKSKDLALSFWYGIKMDLAVASYILAPFCILLILACFIPFFRRPGIYKIYSAVILLPVLIIILCDLPAFSAWGYRLDASPLRYLNTPSEAWASVSHLPVFSLFGGMLVIYVIMIMAFFRFINNNAHLIRQTEKPFTQFLLMLLLTSLQIIPIRGGVQLAPLNQSSVYFSNDNFVNICAINAPWNFIYSLSFGLQDNNNPFTYLNKTESDSISKELLGEYGKDFSPLIDTGKSKPNIIIITWESLTSKVIGMKKGNTPILPGFTKLMKEGVFFSDAYASGDRTDKGIVAILSGYPAQPITTIVKMPEKATKLETLPKDLLQAGYHTNFYYGGEIEFANMKAYLLGAGFNNIVDKNNFEKKDQNSKWGAHDHIVSKRLIKDLAGFKQPFFTTWLTLSSHEPFETGTAATIPGSDTESKFLNSLHYSDSVVYEFIEQCKLQSWWNNTLIVILADHGHRIPSTGNKIDDFRIPILWLGGAVASKNTIIKNIVSQTDLAAMLCGQLKIKDNFPWSRNILKENISQWAYFCFNNGFGFIQPEKYLIYDNVGRRTIEQRGQITDEDTRRGFSIQQSTFEDFLHR